MPKRAIRIYEVCTICRDNRLVTKAEQLSLICGDCNGKILKIIPDVKSRVKKRSHRGHY